MYFLRFDSSEKSFDSGWNWTRVPTVANLQRWPLSHPDLYSLNLLLIYI